MSRTPNFDAKLKTMLDAEVPGERVCPVSGKTWELTAEYIERCRKWNVPPSKLHPFMRMKLLASWGAGVDLWYKPHMLTGKPILTGYHPDTPGAVITDAEYYEKDWGAEHPQDINPSRPFFDQMLELVQKTPMAAFNSYHSENCVGGGYAKSVNTFMLFGTYEAKDSFYSFRNKTVDRVFDAVCLEQCQDSFSCAMSVRLNKCVQCFDSLDCLNCRFVFDGRNCEHCFCSTNLRRRKYVFMNEQLSQSEYERRMSEINLSCTSVFDAWREKFLDLLRNNTVFPEHSNINVQNTNGEYIIDGLNASGYFMSRPTHVKDGWFLFDVENMESCVIGSHAQDCYQCCVSTDSQDLKFCFVIDKSRACEFSINLENCENCFGCSGLKRKKFYIFNKPYAEEDYWRIVDEIKCAMLACGEYGDFMPVWLSPWATQMSFASVAAPLTEDELKNLHTPDYNPVAGMRFAPEANVPVKDVGDVPDCIADVGEEWTRVQFEDALERRKYNVSARELKYRKEKGYPFPRRHYRARLIELFRQINSPEREEAACAKCGKAIEISKNHLFPNRLVYCYDDYLKFIEERN